MKIRRLLRKNYIVGKGSVNLSPQNSNSKEEIKASQKCVFQNFTISLKFDIRDFRKRKAASLFRFWIVIQIYCNVEFKAFRVEIFDDDIQKFTDLADFDI